MEFQVLHPEETFTAYVCGRSLLHQLATCARAQEVGAGSKAQQWHPQPFPVPRSAEHFAPRRSPGTNQQA